MKNYIGLNDALVEEITDKLANLLANYQILYTNTRGFHWNIKGNIFFELHIKFEEIYNDIQLKIDEVAERIITLNGTPKNSFSDYLKISQIKEVSGESNGIVGLQHIVESLSTIVTLQRQILKLSQNANDEGTNSLISTYISEHEKSIWMYHSYLKK